MERVWYTANGAVSGDVRPGDYALAVSRGPEYDLHLRPVSIAAVDSYRERFAGAQLHHDGWISTDLHLPRARSLDLADVNEDRVTRRRRGITFAASTDHNTSAIGAPRSRRRTAGFLVSTVGMERPPSRWGTSTISAAVNRGACVAES